MIWLLLLTLAGSPSQGESVVHSHAYAYAQEGYLSPQQQRTLLEYAGPAANPMVPTAIKRTSEQEASFAAKWLADKRKQAVQAYSFDAAKTGYFGKSGKTLEQVFQLAAEAGQVLYFEDAEQLFGLPNATPAQKDLAKSFVQLAKKAKGAVLVQCVNENSWYALAEAGFGIVDLNL